MKPVILKSRDQVLRAEQLEGGIVHIQLSNFWARRIGFAASCYLVDEVLIDSGFTNARDVLFRFLKDRKIRAVLCTHNHEDHAGNCGQLAALFDCPVYLSLPERRWEEGVSRLAPYRRYGWGKPDPYFPEDMPQEISTGSRILRAIATPGHSQTHVVFFDDRSHTLFVGDLYINPSVGAVMSHENPYDSVRSLRRAAALGAQRMANGHGLVTGEASRRLTEKADRVEAAAERVSGLYSQGHSVRRILRKVFPRGGIKNRFFSVVTSGEFSRTNFVRACLRHGAQPSSSV